MRTPQNILTAARSLALSAVMKRLAIILLLIAAPAVAQSSTTTTCYLNGAIVSCATAGAAPRSNAPNDYTLPDAGEMMQDAKRRDAETAALRAYADGAELEREVGRKLAKGDCAGAEKVALEGGDVDLALKVKTFCASR